MWWTIIEIVLAIIGLVTATTLWNQIQEKRRLLVLGCLMIGIIALSIRKYYETIQNEKTTEKLSAQLVIAKKKSLRTR